MEKIITGIIGHPLSHTFSPAMHNSAFKKFKMNWEYRVFETKPQDVGAFVERSKKEGMKGYNVTIPHKHAVMEYLDSIDRAAAVIGAVNTVVNNNGRLKGYNTDYLGFLGSLKMHHVNLTGKRVVMLGAGGAAHAVGYAINSCHPASFHIYNIDAPMTERLIKQLKLRKAVTGDISRSVEKDAVIARADFIINCTSVGMHGDSMAYDIEKLKKGAVAYDIIYNPAETAFLKRAKKLGARTINGLDMLILQGIEAFAIWTGKRPSHQLYSKAIKKHLRKNDI
ncbi:MAG: shikimate dehydrogenase [Spirochaetia bacterium]|nr:shikimate dehydrogenase [Spirochaetia bacterium]